MKLRYTSDYYYGERWRFFGRTLVQAFGAICGEEHLYAEFWDEEKCPPGTVPERFKQEARLAFIRAYLKIRSERGKTNETMARMSGDKLPAGV